jgi:hypothetical protein
MLLLAAVFGFDVNERIGLALILALIYAPIAIYLMLGRGALGELFRALRRPIAMGFQDARGLLERALVASGLPHHERAPRPGEGAVAWDVREGFVVKLFDGVGQCYVHVGLANDKTRRDVEGPKRATDTELTKAKR